MDNGIEYKVLQKDQGGIFRFSQSGRSGRFRETNLVRVTFDIGEKIPKH